MHFVDTILKGLKPKEQYCYMVAVYIEPIATALPVNAANQTNRPPQILTAPPSGLGGAWRKNAAGVLLALSWAPLRLFYCPVPHQGRTHAEPR